MPLSKLTAPQVKSILQLIEKRDLLLAHAEELNEKINSFAETTPSPSAVVRKTKAPVIKSVKSGGKKRAKRGSLKVAILDALKTAGDKGGTVKQLSQFLKTKPSNIYSSLNYALKTKVAGLKKGDKGKYFFVG